MRHELHEIVIHACYTSLLYRGDMKVSEQFNMRMPVRLRKQLRCEAESQHVTAAEFVRRLLTDYFRKQDNERDIKRQRRD